MSAGPITLAPMEATTLRYRPATVRDALIASEVVAKAAAAFANFTPPGWRPRSPLLAEPELHDILSRGYVKTRLAFSGSAAVGVAGWQPARDTTEPRDPIPGRAHLWAFFVVPDWWGKGVASELLEWATTGMADSGYESAQLWAVRDNARARAFYEREGWLAAGPERHSPELNLDLVLYERTLD
jgi:GNAT superfamily N-acetyltransferase